jgi:hypothetical protein
VRLACEGCGHDLLVAFSCKGRGFCPSCGGRRMTQTAAHLVDRVFPEAPVRQWVLSAPFELRFLLARQPAVLTALDRIFVDEIGRFYRRRSEAEGRAGARTGAVTFVQRFGGSLNLHVHFHVVVPDGVFTREPGKRAVFHPTTAPRPEELAVVVSRVAQRMTRWLVQQGHASRSVASGSEEESGEADGWLQLSLAGGQFVRLVTDDEDEDDGGAFGPRRRDPMAAESQGFSLHAGVRVAASDREARERLFRYGARPALCLERLSLLPDGRVAYRLKKRGRRGATHRVMTPQELMARLAALVPPPWHPLTRFHGVLAPHHAWRSSVVPPKTAAPKRCCPAPPKRQLELDLDDAGGEPPRRSRRTKPREAQGNRIDGAELLARTFDLDVLACPRCPGRLHVVEVITDPQRAVEWLSRRGRTEKLPPSHKRATAPPEQLPLPFPRSPSPRR